MNLRNYLGVCMLLLAAAEHAHAGMPSIRYGLSEAVNLRLEQMSLFLMGFFLIALGVKALWNFVAHDFPTLPKLTYGRALILMILWGLLFSLVLIMIDGAREMMTPGAWQNNGVTYELRQE